MDRFQDGGLTLSILADKEIQVIRKFNFDPFEGPEIG
jgi:hypothetical protein